jgi:predicted outer membrane repeat protein
MSGKLYACLIVLAFALLIVSCGDEDDSPEPVTGLEVSPDTVTVEISQELVLTATVSGGSSKKVQWYVAGVLGGNSTWGTITQTNPAAYISPDQVPIYGPIGIRAVSEEDESKMDSCLVDVEFNTVNVDGATGDDETGTGGPMKPVKTIAKGLELADVGLTVKVASGTYHEHDLVMKSGVKLTSETGEPGSVTIDAQGQGRVFDCDLVDTTGVIIGFTITGGHATGSGQESSGGAMWCRSASSVKVKRCRFTDNRADMYGGVAYCITSGSPRFIECTFAGNYAETKGGVFLTASTCALRVERCTFFGNGAGMASGGGGAIYVNSPSAILSNTIIAFSWKGEAVYVQEEAQEAVLTCCDLFGNAGGDYVGRIADQIGIDGNFSADPAFCDTLGGNFTLGDCSPCLPGNHPDGYDCGGVIGAWGEGCTCP